MTTQLAYGRTFLLGFGLLGITIVSPIFNQYVPIFLQAGNPEFERQLIAEGRALPDLAGLGLAPGLAMFMMSWDNLINIFIQPWAGARSDRTWNRFGRRKPWILLGAPIALLGFVFIPLAQSLLAIATFILITNLGMAVFRSPTVAWLGDLFAPRDRSKANGVVNLMGGVGGLLAYFGGGMLFNSFGRAAPFAAGAVAMCVALTAALLLVEERAPLAADKRGELGVIKQLGAVVRKPDSRIVVLLLGIACWGVAFNALETGLSSFAVFTLGMPPGTASIYTGLVTLSFIACAVPAGWLGSRYGRTRIIRFGLAVFVLVAAVGFVAIDNRIALAVALVLIGACWALINVNSLPLIHDHGDESRIGAATGLYYLASQLSAVAGPTLAGILVGALDNQYRWLWLFTAAFLAMAWWVMGRVRG